VAKADSGNGEQAGGELESGKSKGSTYDGRDERGRCVVGQDDRSPRCNFATKRYHSEQVFPLPVRPARRNTAMGPHAAVALRAVKRSLAAASLSPVVGKTLKGASGHYS